MIAIIDYGMGNLRSVSKGFESLGYSTSVTRNADEISNSSGIVLPGVGAFGDCIRNLHEFDLIEPIELSITKDKPFLGICLGLQVLFEGSEESPGIRGLGIFEGKIVKFPKFADKRLKIPHMGWNQVEVTKETPLLQGIPNGSWFYFVHSYYPEFEDQEIIAGKTTYGLEFACAVSNGNTFACQFHPEKSSNLGLRILRNFALMCEEKKKNVKL
ncbi:MAG: imidazole glycerol phosphate synthase subunit HisH [Deltaproteobacteria bacterium]|nr:imidazole glycerol phosphate synthase subunit HisH [Deltaproteobacteria bacterium]